MSAAIEARLTIAVGSPPSRFVVEVELELAAGVLVLFGPSGAGKSLTVQALAGLLTPADGRLVVLGETLFDAARGVDVPAHRRRFGYVPQHHALFPRLNVRENVAFGLPRAERKGTSPRVAELLAELGIEALAEAPVERLSGGERQRVALARALAVEPRLLLLDEPFASIDHEGRGALGASLREALARRRTPAVLVTHDPDEARRVGDRVTRFTRGKTVESGAPSELLAQK